MLAGEAPTGDLALAANGHSHAAAARLAAAPHRRASRGGEPSSGAMLLRRLRWVLAGALVAWTLVRAFGLERGWPLVPLFAFTPYVAPVALLVAALAAWRRWWAGAAVTGACALLLLALLAPRAIPDRAPADAPGVRVRVLAANVAANDAAAGRVIAAVRRWDVDVFSVLELPPEVVRAYDAAGRGRAVPHRALQPRPGFSGHRALLAAPAARRPRRPRGTRFAFAAAELRAARRRAGRAHRRPPARAHRPRRDRAVAARHADAAGLRAQGRRACWRATSTRRSTTPSCGACSAAATATPPSRPASRCAPPGRAAGPACPRSSRSTTCWPTAGSASSRPAASRSRARTTAACSPSCCCRG